MSKLILILLLLGPWLVQAQEHGGKKALLKFIRVKNPSYNYQWPRQSPQLMGLTFLDQPSLRYWQGASYTSYSENGQIQSTHAFDIHGQLRETTTSINLRKKGVLSSWRVQFSSQRTRPVFIFKIR